jgi:hypothetical protein
MLLSIAYISQAMSEDQEEQRFEVDIDNNDDFEENSAIAQPTEITREEVVAVVETNAETSPMDDEEEEENKNEDIYDQVKTQSIQLSRLADAVESLQSQVKQLQETTRLRRPRKTTSVRARSRSNNSMKTKKKRTTKRRGKGGSKKK